MKKRDIKRKAGAVMHSGFSFFIVKISCYNPPPEKIWSTAPPSMGNFSFTYAAIVSTAFWACSGVRFASFTSLFINSFIVNYFERNVQYVWQGNKKSAGKNSRRLTIFYRIG